MGKGQNNYYNTKLSDIHLAQSLWLVKRHTIYKELEKLKYELTNPETSNSESQVRQFLRCLLIQDNHFQHIYNYVYNLHTQDLGN